MNIGSQSNSYFLKSQSKRYKIQSYNIAVWSWWYSRTHVPCSIQGLKLLDIMRNYFIKNKIELPITEMLFFIYEHHTSKAHNLAETMKPLDELKTFIIGLEWTKTLRTL